VNTLFAVLCTFTAGRWGRYGDDHGRRTVLAFTTVGALCTLVYLSFTGVAKHVGSRDFLFLLATKSHSPSYGSALLLITPFFEGTLGGLATYFASTHAWVYCLVLVTLFGRIWSSHQLCFWLHPSRIPFDYICFPSGHYVRRPSSRSWDRRRRAPLRPIKRCFNDLHPQPRFLRSEPCVHTPPSTRVRTTGKIASQNEQRNRYLPRTQ